MIKIEISPGELIDRLTILEIKTHRILDEQKKKNVCYEQLQLIDTLGTAVIWTPELEEFTQQLRVVNEILWDTEDRIRECERLQDFGPIFVELARSVYRRNDQRAALKRQINQILESKLLEEKSYSPY